MNGTNGSLTNKLILLVLTGILGCLVFMLVRSGNNLLESPDKKLPVAKNSPTNPTTPADVSSDETGPRHTAAIGLPRAQPSIPKTSAPPVVAATRVEPEVEPRVPTPVPFTGRLVETPPPPPIGGVVTTRFNATVSGRVYLRGTPPPEKVIALDAVCAKLQPAGLKTRFYVVGNDGGLANVFVYIKEGAPQNYLMPDEVKPLLDQIGCQYQPYVMGVRTGQKFAIKNSDPVLHNPHATPTINKEYGLLMVTKGQMNEKSFAKPEVFVRIKCDVHPWMFAYVGVVDHPWFAVTDANGNFQLPYKLPSGKYRLAVVHLKAGGQIQDIELAGDTTAPLSFTFDVK